MNKTDTTSDNFPTDRPVFGRQEHFGWLDLQDHGVRAEGKPNSSRRLE